MMKKIYFVKIDEDKCKSIIDSKYKNDKMYHSKLTQSNSIFIGYTYETELRYIGFFCSDKYKKFYIYSDGMLLSLDKKSEYNGDHSNFYKNRSRLSYYVQSIKEYILKLKFKLFQKVCILKKLYYDDILEIFSEYYIEKVLRENNITSSSVMSFVDESGTRELSALFASENESIEDIMAFSQNAAEYLKHNHNKYTMNTVTSIKQPW